MKIDTISTYILVYLLTCVRFNVYVPAKADGGQTASSSQPAQTGYSSSATHTATPKSGVDVNITSDTYTIDDFDLNQDGDYVTYTPKRNNAIKPVKDDKVDVRKGTNANNYSSKVEIECLTDNNKAVTTFLAGNKTIVFKKSGMKEPWNDIDLSKLNPISVNITDDKDTFFYSNKLLRYIRTFEAHTGFGFNVVTQSIGSRKVEIWTTNNPIEYAKIVVYARYFSGKLDLTVLSNDEKKYFIKEREDVGWKEIDITKVNPEPVNIRDRYHSCFYNYSFNNEVRTFTARTGFSFNNVKDGDTDIWKTTNQKEFAKKVVEGNNKVTIHIGVDGTRKVFNKGTYGNWIEDKAAATTPPDPSGLSTQSQVRLFKVNHSNPANPLELGAGEYNSTTSGNVVSYPIANGVNCTQIMFDNVLLWAHDPNQRGGIYPKSVDHDTTTDTLVLRFEGLDLTFAKNDQGQWVFTESGPLAVKFHLPDPNDSTKTVELASNQFTVTESGDITTFTIANGVNSIALTYGPALLWHHDPNQRGGKHPKSLDYNKSTETLVLGFDGFYLTFAKNDQGQWVFTETDTSARGVATTTPPDPSGLSTQSQVRLFKVNHSNPANPLELGAGEYNSTTSGNVVSYPIANGVNCTQIMFDNVLLWAHDPNQRGGIYPKSVDHDTTTDTLVLRFEGLDLTFAKNDQGQWVFTESGPLAVKFHLPDPNDSTKTVELASNQFTVTESGDITTFTIANGVNSIALTYGPALLWHHDPNQRGGIYPKSVDHDTTTDTLVLRFEGLDITFAKNDQGQWVFTETDTSARGVATTTPPDPSGLSTQSQVRLFKVNHSNPANPLELGAGEYNSTTSGNVVSYPIANGVNCTQIMFDNVLLWAHDPNQRGGIYPKSVDHDTTTDTLVLRFEGLDLTFAKNDQGQWVFTESGPLAVKFHLPDPNDSTKTVELASNQFTVTESGDITTFTIANGVNSIALTYGPALLWHHDPNQRGGIYPKSVDHDTTTDTLVLRFEGLDITFAKNDQGQWVFTETDTSARGVATTTPPDPSGLSTQSQVRLFKVNHSNPANPLELGAGEYNSTTSGNVVSYPIANGVNCTQIMFDNVLLWAHDPNQRGGIYPKSVDHDTTTDTLVLRFEGLDLTFAKNDQGQWVFTESGPLAVKFHLPDPNDSTKTVELASNQFTVTESGDITTFTIANGVNSIALTYGPALLWHHDPNQRGGIYPKSVDHDTTTDTLVLRFEGLDITFAKNDQGQWVFTETDTSARGVATTTPPDPSGLSTQSQVRLFKVNHSNPANPLELGAGEYNSTTSGNVVSYPIANGVNCTQIMFDNVLLWAHDPNQRGGIYPKSVDHDTTTDTLVLRFEGLDLTFAKNDQGQWVFTETDTSARGVATTTPPDPSGLSTQSQVRLFKVNHSNPANPLELGAGEYNSTTSGNVVSYPIANGVNCTQIMFDNVLLWAHDPNQRGGIYPKSVDHDTTTDTLVLRFEGLDLTFAKNDQGQWVFTESGPLAVKFHLPDPNDSTKTVELASNQFTVTESGDITTFTIANGVNSIALTYGPALLWHHDPNQRGGKHPKSLDYNKSTETLVLGFDGFYLTFAKNDQGQWVFTETDTSARGVATTTPPDPSGLSTQSQVRLFKVNHSNPANPLELGAGEYNSTTSGNVVSYPIANGVNCTQIMFDNVLLWAHDPNQRGGIYPKSVDHDTTTDTLVLRFEGLDITFAKNDQGQWVFTESGPLAVKFHLPDPNDSTKTVELASNQFTVTESGDITTFTIANGVNSIALTYGPALLWHHDPNQRGGKHPKSLDYNKSTETLVLGFDGFYLTFAKNDQGQWVFTETDTSARGVATTTPPDPSGLSTQPQSSDFIQPEDKFTIGHHLNDLVKKPQVETISYNTSIGFPSGCHDNSDIVYVPEPILNNLYPDFSTTSWARDDLDVDQYVTFVNILPEMNLSDEDVVFDLSVITLATETTPYKIIQGNDEMLIKKHKIDEVFNKYSCSLTNERKFKPHIRHLLSNFELKVDDVSEFELYAGEFDEPLLIRMKNPSGWTTYIRKRDNIWEVDNVPSLDTNVLDKHYLNLRDDITMIDCSKTSGTYVFGKYKVVVTDPDPKDVGQLAGYKTYVHTIYYNTSSIEFTSAKVHRFKYGTTSLDGFMRYWMSKVYVHFWEHELTKPIYIRAFADHGIANYFGYPNYTMQTDVSMFPYFLKLTNFEVNNALVINLARHQKYDFEGGVSPHLTRHQVTVTLHDNSPLQSFRRNVHTLSVGDENKQFNILRFLNEPTLNEVITNVSSLETYFHNKHLNKPLMFTVNKSSEQIFYKLEKDNYVKMDNLIIDLENTLKYLAYHNYKYVAINVTKTSAYYYTGASNPSSMPDCNLIVSVDKEEFKEFSKFTHSIKAENQQSNFKLIALDGVKINIDDSELTSVDCYFFNEHNDTPLLVILKGTTDLIYAIKKSHPIKKDSTFLTSLNDNLRNLVQFNFGLLYLKIDKTANYYNKQDYGFEIEVSQDGSVGNYTKYVHTFPSFSDVCFVVRDDYYHTKIDPPGKFTKAFVYKDSKDLAEIVSLIDDKQEPRHFIYQDNKYKRAKKESVDRKLGITGSQVQTEGNDQS